MRRLTSYLATIALIAGGLSTVGAVIVSPRASVAHANVGQPAWWSGDCDAQHWNAAATRAGWTGAGAHRLGASYLGVAVCGPAPTSGAPDVTWSKTGWGEYEWECTELAFRFMAQLYGVSAYNANGNTVVSHYSTSAGGGLVKVSNGTAGKPPQPGDVMSFNAGSFGHVAVVAAASVDPTGNGSIRLLTQNDTSDGWRTLTVSHWTVAAFGGQTPYGWLHDPAGRGNPARPADGTFVSIAGHQEVYRVAGGAPVYLPSWSAFGGPQPITILTQAQFDGLATYPADATILRSGSSGSYFQVRAGGAIPLMVLPSGAKTTVVDPLTIALAGATSFYDHLRDVIPPAVAVNVPPPFTTRDVTSWSWSASDAGSGLGHYLVRWQRASYSSGFGSWQYPTAWQFLTSSSLSLSGLTPGYDYCLSVQAVDKAGNASVWSPAGCVSRVLDDQVLAASPGWQRLWPDARFYQSSNTTAYSPGASLTLASAQLARLGVLATRCARCGELAISVGSTLIGKINLYAPSTQFQALLMLPTMALRSGTIRITVLSTGKAVQIDGLALSRS